MKRLLTDPRFYVAWLVFLVLSLSSAYAIDPYVFGFAVLGLGAATGLVCLAGGYAVVKNRGTSRRGRMAVLTAILLAVAAFLAALAILRTFKWA